jgi:hypothetical protein
MFSQTPERQASTHRDVTRRESTPRRSAAKGYVEVGKAVMERSQPAAPVAIPPTAEIVEAPVTPAPSVEDIESAATDSEESLTDNIDETI